MAECEQCGEDAKGYATIDGKRYCHGDQEQPTCYMRASQDLTRLSVAAFAKELGLGYA